MATYRNLIVRSLRRLALLLAIGVACAPGSACIVQQGPGISPGARPQNGIWFTGTYLSDRVSLSLVQQGHHVTGTGQLDGVSGTVEGEVEGAGLRGRYTASTGATGAFEAVLTDGGLEVTIEGAPSLLLVRQESGPTEPGSEEAPEEAPDPARVQPASEESSAQAR
jgi:hypothetical protein